MFDIKIIVQAEPSDFKDFVNLMSELAKGRQIPKEVEEAYLKLKAQVKAVDDLIPDVN